jgi:hypothetical protein
MSEMAFKETTFEHLESVNEDRILEVYDYWANKTLEQVAREMPEPTYLTLDEERQVKLVELEPNSWQYDETKATVLGLPFLNGYTPQHYMRAKTLQILMGSENPLWIMPNNSHKDNAYTLADSDRIRLATGNIKPLGELEMRAFEKLRTMRGIGSLSISGYSQGGLTALAMGAAGSDILHIEAVNADEAPSKTYRSAKELQKDFLSGGMFDVPNAAKDADIDALTDAMSKPKFILDIMRFFVQSKRHDSKLIHHAMSGSVDGLVAETLGNNVPVKLGHVEGSPMFDPESIDETQDNLTIVSYTGASNRGHATGDNIIAHALMAKDGLDKAR